MPQVKLVVVTGSGRSGTSSVAGALKRLGLHIPQPEVEADDRNPLGYYEPAWVAAFHKRFLDGIPVRTIDSRPNAAEIAMSQVTPELEAELRAWVEAETTDLPDGTVVAIKDPRAFWVYPLWRGIADQLGLEITSLTMLRHPAQVVRSRDTAYLTEQSETFRRQRETTNVAAWINSIFETERATRDNARAWVPYPDLIGDWRAALSRACGQLHVPLGDLTPPHPVDDFITTSLNRSAATWDGLAVAPGLVDMAERTWAAAAVLVESPQDATAIAELEALRSEYAELYETSAAIALDEISAQVRAVRQSVKERIERKDRTIAELQARVRDLEGQRGLAGRARPVLGRILRRVPRGR